MISVGLNVTKVIIYKGFDLSPENYNTGREIEECMYEITFANDEKIESVIENNWSNRYFELFKEEYSHGIYEYVDNKFIQIENWN